MAGLSNNLKQNCLYTIAVCNPIRGLARRNPNICHFLDQFSQLQMKLNDGNGTPVKSNSCSLRVDNETLSKTTFSAPTETGNLHYFG